MQCARQCLVFLALLTASAAADSKATHPAAASKPQSPNVILITLDTTRADRMGFLGSTRGLTPNLDALAKHSIVFTRAYAQVPLTTPSHAALLTGTYPQFNHIEDLGAALGKDLPYLPDLLRQHGYQTAAFVGAQILDPAATAPGFERGFDVYDANFHPRKPGEDRYQSMERRAEDVANRALGWLSHHQQKPFFAWLHFYDAHDPYDPPEPFKTQYASAPYDGEIAYTDSVVGSLLQVLQKHGLFENTLIVIAADHGEAFGEHGEERHGMFLYDETIHVPLLVKLPGERSAGKRIHDRVELAQIAPSVLQAVAMTPPSTMQARSFLPLLGGPKAAIGETSQGSQQPQQPIYSETNYGHRTFGWAKLESWRTGKYLYVQAPKRELYDESSDPGALQNLTAGAKAVADTLATQLAAFEEKTVSAGATPRPKLDLAQQEKLRALGYLPADTQPANAEQKAAIDPKDKIEIANKFHRGLVDLAEGRYDEAIANLRDVIRLDPDVTSGYTELGRALVQHKQYEEALPILKIAAARMPDVMLPHFELGKALIETHQWEAALTEMQAATVLNPESAQLHFFLAGIHARLKQLPDAEAEFEKSLRIDPEYFEANLTYGRLLLLEGKNDAALARLQRATKINPDSAEVHHSLAEAYHRLGQEENADREAAKAEQLKPRPPQ